MKTFKKYLPFILIAAIFLAACNEKEIPPEKEKAPALTIKINNFIKEVMSDVYLWYDEMPDIDILYEFDSEAYFYKLLYDEDKWSYVTDDVSSLEGGLEGIQTSFGYALAFGQFVNQSGVPTGEYFAIVEYVYPGSPAADAGLERGDLIIKINDTSITAENYQLLFITTHLSVTEGTYSNGIIYTGSTIGLTAEVLDLDPVIKYNIIERSGHKIGYLMYVQFISRFDTTSLYQALQYFKDNQITDLVLDLRYNPGGQVSAAQYLCSSIAPQTVVDDNSKLVTYQWNDKYQAYWIANGVSDQLGVDFDPTVPVKLNMNKVYILTGYGTASASELTICGLEPYMDVVQIGDATYGKYTAMIVISPDLWYTNQADYEGFETWGIMPVVMRYANSEGLTNFINGFQPDFEVDDELLPAYPLGDITEPLLKKAVEEITGEVIGGGKKGEAAADFIVIDRMSSKFDKQLRNLFIDTPKNLKK